MTEEDRIVGCLLGGAIGDALGAGIEFMSFAEIRRAHGPAGVTGFVPAYGRLGAITDDTQMTLFTTEGLIRAHVRGRERGIWHPPSCVRFAYLRWLVTQSPSFGPNDGTADPGWLFGVKELHHRRAPGNTCMSALQAGGDGELDKPINDSKGCGGLMRAAPVGFVNAAADERFQWGCEVAALTHGHPDGYLPAGFLAAAVGALVDGATMADALDEAERETASAEHGAATLWLVREARALGADGLPTPDALERLGGGGWVGHEALAIAIACCVSAPDFRSGVLAAVNHSGDSDSTGSIAGNLLGAAGGTGVLPPEWLADLELHDVIEQLGRDAALELRAEPPTSDDGSGGATAEWFERYPGV